MICKKTIMAKLPTCCCFCSEHSRCFEAFECRVGEDHRASASCPLVKIPDWNEIIEVLKVVAVNTVTVVEAVNSLRKDEAIMGKLKEKEEEK